MNRNITIKYLIIFAINVVAICFTLSACGANDTNGVKISKENFPDGNFQEYLLSTPEGADKVFTDEEIQTITSIDVSKMEISDLKGIEYFTKLENLICQQNNIESIDLSKNLSLKKFDCFFNKKLLALDVSANTQLEALNCSACNIAELDISKNTHLTDLKCYGNALKSLDVSNQPELAILCCYLNDIDSLNVSANTKLRILYCYDNNLLTLDVSNNPALVELGCEWNKLSQLDVSNNLLLEKLSCGNNNFDYVDLSNNRNLKDYGDGFNSAPSNGSISDNNSSDAEETPLRIGMSKSEVRLAWGEPIDIDKTTTSRGTEETWWYKNSGNTVAVDFDVNGRVRLISE